MNELRNNQHTDLDLHLCSQACVFVCLFPRYVRACVWMPGGGGGGVLCRGARGNNPQPLGKYIATLPKWQTQENQWVFT